jgi:hypothetical protein
MSDHFTPGRRTFSLGWLGSQPWFLPLLLVAALLALATIALSTRTLLNARAAVLPTSTPVLRSFALAVPAPSAVPIDPRLLDPQHGRKLSALYVVLYRAYHESGPAAAEALARQLGMLDDQGVEAVLILDRPYSEAFGQRLRALGVTVESWYENRVTIQVPMDRLLQLASQDEETLLRLLLSLPEVVDVDTPQRPERDEVVPISQLTGERAFFGRGGPVEGVRVVGADRWHAAGLRGQNVRIGIVDSFARYRELQGRYLPPASQIVARDFTGKGFERETDLHGTAVAQVIYEMAPGATLYLANTDDLVQFLQAMDWLLSQRVDIISLSLGFPGFLFDGTSPAARKVDEARQRGVLVVVSAGNEGNKSVLGRTSGTPGLVAVAPEGPQFIPVSYWPRPDAIPQVRLAWGAPEAELVLHLADERGKVVASFERRSGSGRPTIAGVADRRAGADRFYVGVEQKSGPPTLFRLQVTNGEISPYYRSAAMSLADIAAARGALAVGAADWKTGQLAVYSSWGPTLDGRWKPELIAPSHVSVFVYQDQEYGFTGTSAAAPHVAGAAALVKSRYPTFTAEQIQRFLLEHARPLGGNGTFGYYAAGAGMLSLPDPSTLR